eukprot:g75440.t1
MLCVERMQRICARAMYDVDLTKERKRMFHTVDLATRVYGKDHLLYEHPDTDSQEGIYFVQFGTNIFTVRLGGEFGDGPTCTCKDPDPRLCLHIIIVYYDARVYYTAEQWSDWGWQGNQDDRVYLTLRGMSLVLQEGDDNQEADDDNSNFDNDDNHDNSQAKTDDELKHMFKEITDGLDVLFEKLRLDGLFKHKTNRRTLLMKRPKPHAAGLPKSAKTDLPERRFGRPPKSREAERNSRATMPSRVVQRVLDADTQRRSHSSSSSSCLPSSPNLSDPRRSLDFAPSVSHVQPAGFPPQFLGPKHLPSHSHFPSVSYVQPASFPPQLFVPLHLPNPSLFPLASRVQPTGFPLQRPGPNHLPQFSLLLSKAIH